MTKTRKPLAVAILLVLVAATTLAQPPTPELNRALTVFYSPGGTKEYQVIMQTLEGPTPDVLIRLEFSDEAVSALCWCAGVAQSVFEATTDSNGVASFFIAAGGCLKMDEFAEPPIRIYGDGVLLNLVGGTSPDAVDNAGLLPHQGWNPGSQCEVGLGDLVYHTNPISSATYDPCTDFNDDHKVDIEDAVFITVPLTEGHFCPSQ